MAKKTQQTQVMDHGVVGSTSFSATVEEVAKVPTPPATKTFLPIPFIDLINLTTERLGANGFEIVGQGYSLVKPKKEKHPQQIFGVMDIQPAGGDGVQHPDWRQVIGIRSSHNKTLPVGFAGGSRVFVCTNLAFVGDLITMRKHTVNAIDDLPVLLDEMLDKLGDVFKKQTVFIDGLKDKNLTLAQGHDIMMNAARAGAFPVSKLMGVANAWDIERGVREPREGEHARFGYSDKGDTAWDLYNAFTYVNAERTAENQMDDSMALTKVFAGALGLS